MHTYGFIIALFFSLQLFAQDTLKITLQETEKIFLEKNLLLLAKQYDIEAADALLMQAKLYPNPTFTASLNLIDPENNKILHIGNTGQKEFVLEQMIILGGKRRSEILIARKNKELAQADFNDLLRNLQYQLRSSYFNVYQQNLILSTYQQQIQVLDSMIVAYEQQTQKGNIPTRDVVRLKAISLKIHQERSSIIRDLIEENQKLQIVLQTSAIIQPVVDENLPKTLQNLPKYAELVEIALQNRSDLKLLELESELASMRLRLQKQLVTPDMALNLAYDQRGGAFGNQINVGVALPLPLWNRNKGNIKLAEISHKTSRTLKEQKKKEIETEVLAAWQNMQKNIFMYEKSEQIYSKDFEQVFEGVKANFRKRNISLLEFVDFFESYNESLAEHKRIQVQLIQSAVFINFVVFSNIYNF
jgi:cobalt-zinc-cadmium efflux system outer membrane protein